MKFHPFFPYKSPRPEADESEPQAPDPRSTLPYPIAPEKSVFVSLLVAAGLTAACVSAAGLVFLAVFHLSHSLNAYALTAVRIFAVLLPAGILLFAVGWRRFRWYIRFYTYISKIGSRVCLPIAELAESCGEPAADTSRQLRRMIHQGLFPEGRIDEKKGMLYLTRDS
jgi:hypothetical protein